jgi:hypothetical protein
VNLTNAEEIARVYCQGLDNREMRSTFVNETSSRSHLIFSIFIEQIDVKSMRTMGIGKLSFIDLAGSESLNEIGVDLKRYKEGIQINEGLICLGQLIRQAVIDKQDYDLHPLT